LNRGRIAKHLTLFGRDIDILLERIGLNLREYADQANVDYKYISQLRTMPNRRPGKSYINLIKPFVKYGDIGIVEVQQYSQRHRGKPLSLNECKELFPNIKEVDFFDSLKDTTEQPTTSYNQLSNGLKELNKNFGIKIKSFRENQSMSQNAFASLIDEEVNVSIVNKWEKGVGFPTSHLYELLDVLGVAEIEFDRFALNYVNDEVLMMLKNKDINSLNHIISLSRRTWLLGGYNRTNHINIISARSSLKSQFSDRASPNYTFLDNLGDRDSIFELAVIFSRLYPVSEINLYHSLNFPSQIAEDDVIVLGGIGYPGKPNNHFALRLIEEKGIPLEYDGISLIYNDKRWDSVYQNDILIKDVGFISSFKNPFNPKKRVVTIQGIHTLGVLGAVRAFSLNAAAIENHKIAQKLFGKKEYCCIFDVNIFGERPVIARLKEESFFPLE
jgi:DNA-binding transcriptional regulator YiaG